MRPIDADALQAEFEWLKSVVHYHERDRVEDAVQRVKNAPTIEAEPVRHGKWCIHKVDVNVSTFYCSECDRTVKCGNDYFMKPTKLVSKIYPYCHCGAKMDLEEEE